MRNVGLLHVCELLCRQLDIERGNGVMQHREVSLRLGEGEWALTSLIKCPGGWDPSCADACRQYMRSELSSIAPRAIVLMGMNGARYMLGERGTDDAYLGRRFIVNHIPLYVTYSPAEYRADRSLRTRIWDNLLFIRKELGLDAVR